jgi:hypothetical protein
MYVCAVISRRQSAALIALCAILASGCSNEVLDIPSQPALAATPAASAASIPDAEPLPSSSPSPEDGFLSSASANYRGIPPSADVLLAAGVRVCEGLAAGIPRSQINALDTEIQNRTGDANNLAIVAAAVKWLCAADG